MTMTQPQPKNPSARPIRIEGDVGYIDLTLGYVATIDAEDAPLVWGLNWMAKPVKRKDGSIRFVYAINGWKRLHHMIADAMFGDHPELDPQPRDGNALNCRRSNLHLARRKVNEATGLPGVRFLKRQGKFRAAISLRGKQHTLGLFDTAEEAHTAYLAARKRGEP